MTRHILAGVVGFFLLLAALVLWLVFLHGDSSGFHAQWSEMEIQQMRHLQFSEPIAREIVGSKNLSNELLHDQAALELGKVLFHDPNMSASRQVACASCHQPEYGYQDKTGMTYQLDPGARHRAPGLLGVAMQDWFFWDGRADSLWSQALASLENPSEHGTTRVQVVRHLCSTYFPAFPELLKDCQQLRLPAHLLQASPLSQDSQLVASWLALPPGQQRLVNQLFVRVGKSIAAFEASLLPPVTRFDRYVDAVLAGNSEAAAKLLTEKEAAGLRLFLDTKTGCFNCHHGPSFANSGFSAIATDHPGEPMWDRQHGVAAVLANEFNCLNWGEPEACPKLLYIKKQGADLVGAYKVPSLRNLKHAPSFMHDGRYKDLTAVINHYQNPDLLPLRHVDIRPMALLPHQREQLLAFLKVLGDELSTQEGQ